MSLPYGFTPALSTACASSLSTLAVQLEKEPTACGFDMSFVLLNSTMFSICTQGARGNVNPYYSDCFNVEAVINAGYDSSDMVPAYHIPPLSECSVCHNYTTFEQLCVPLMSALTNATYGAAVNTTLFDITEEADISDVYKNLQLCANACSNPDDQTSMLILMYQSQVQCASGQMFGHGVSEAGYIDGVLDMRALPQCGSCAVVPCLAGQLCDGSGEAAYCPAGYYCPTTAEKKLCPENHYCPLASTEPVKCRTSGVSTCPAGSEREIVWVPLFASIILFIALFMGLTALNMLKNNRRKEQEVQSGTMTNTTSPPSSKNMKSGIPLLPSPSHSSHSVSIMFNDLQMVTNGNKRIDHVSGLIRPGTFTAILGGSGAGKTSLMNVLLGREARSGGEVAYYTNKNSLEQEKEHSMCVANEQKDNSIDEKELINPKHSSFATGTSTTAVSLPSSLLDKIVAFVPQNDVYLSEMTVLEIVEHSARCRLPVAYSSEQIDNKVEEVLDQLHMQHLRDTVVGGGFSTGNSLSPGDKKKVNIAMELVSSPAVLFLDEPTTGIDASAAMNVALIISNLARIGGLTCVAVIHQPRAEIFNLIDDMIIMVRGGKMAYQGPRQHVLGYFEMHGSKLPCHQLNATDFLIDITSSLPDGGTRNPLARQKDVVEEEKDVVEEEGEEGNANTTENGKQVSWVSLWNDTGGPFLERMAAGHPQMQQQKQEQYCTISSSSSTSSSKSSNTAPHDRHDNLLSPSCSGNDGDDVPLMRAAEQAAQQQLQETSRALLPTLTTAAFATNNNINNNNNNSNSSSILPLDTERPGFTRHFWLYLVRGTKQHFKNNAILSDLITYFIGGCILGVVTCGGSLFITGIPTTYTGNCPPGAEDKCNVWLRFEIGPATFLISMILGALTIPGAVKCFGHERPVFSREVSVGSSKAGYFLGKCVSELPFLAANVFVFMTPLVAIAPWRSPLDMLLGIYFSIAFVVMSMGFLLSFAFDDPHSAVLTGAILAVLLNLFSGFVPLLGDGPMGVWMYTHYAARAICTAELWYGQGINSNSDYNDVVPDEWQDPDLSKDILGIFGIAFILQISSFFALLYLHKRVTSFD